MKQHRSTGWTPPIELCQATITGYVYIPPGVAQKTRTFRCELLAHDPFERSHQTTVDGKLLMFP